MQQDATIYETYMLYFKEHFSLPRMTLLVRHSSNLPDHRTDLRSLVSRSKWRLMRSPCCLSVYPPEMIPTGYEAGWVSESVWTLWSRDKSLVSAGNRTPAVQPVVCQYTN
jgi:hypothetical protein